MYIVLVVFLKNIDKKVVIYSVKFDKWSEGQRKCVLQDFLSRCSAAQLRFVSSSLERQLPLQAVDFTCMLPRVLSLFIFSYLDPRSLCRCATVRGRVDLSAKCKQFNQAENA